MSVTNFVMPDKCSVIQMVRTAKATPLGPVSRPRTSKYWPKLIGFQRCRVQRQNLLAQVSEELVGVVYCIPGSSQKSRFIATRLRHKQVAGELVRGDHRAR
jgi:hypothetical protein